MNSENFNANNEQNAEKLNRERQKGKLVGFYLSGGDKKYISGEEQIDESDMPEAKNAVLEMMRDGLIPEETERKLLTDIYGPDHRKGNNGVFEDINREDFSDITKQKKQILGYMTGEKWDDYYKTSGSNVSVFLSEYPTPMDFEPAAEDLLDKIDDGYNSQEIVQEYYEAMDAFQHDVYGKKYEYFKVMKDLHREAKELGVPQKNEIELKENQEMIQRFSEIFNKEKVVKDACGLTRSRGSVLKEKERNKENKHTEEYNKVNEDAAFLNTGNGLYAVFDGTGGEKGGDRASGLAKEMLGIMTNEKDPQNINDLKEILSSINEAIKNDSKAGMTTAVVGKIMDRGGQKSLLWASIGDSRIYLVRKGEPAKQITTDEGEGHVIHNCLGDDIFKIAQIDEEPLIAGDRIVFCSDGITGDYEKDFIPNDEFGHIVQTADTAEIAASKLMKRATKTDDRTVIVVEV